MSLRKTITLLSAAVLLAVGAKAQKQRHADSIGKDGMVYQFVEQMPEFPGGSDKVPEYISENLHYPDSARNANKEGRVTVRFVVMEDGSIKDATIMSPRLGYGMEEEVIRVVLAMPKWTPGISNGKAVKVYYTLPITFRLEDDPPKKG